MRAILSMWAIAATLCIAAAPPASASEVLWEIGKPDDSAAEYALGPRDYTQFKEDGFFVVGWSDPARDWPYVHPGPADGWAGGRAHTYTIVFALDALPEEGLCRLRYDLVDAHATAPPRLRIQINGKEFSRKVPPGKGDASIFGNPAAGEGQQLQVSFKSGLLKTGDNEILIKNEDGSWFLYDSLALDTPPGAKLSKAAPTLAWLGNVTCPQVLYEENGQLLQPLQAPLRYYGEATKARLLVSGLDPIEQTIQAGNQQLEVRVPAVDEEKTVQLALEIDGKVQAEREATFKPVRKWTIYMMHHTHLDIGYTHHQDDVMTRQWEHLEKAMEIAEATKDYPEGSRFKWLPEGFWAIQGYLENASEEKKAAFIEAVRNDTVSLDALYGNALTALSRPEELLELTSYARRFAKEYGVTIDTAMITDVPGYTWGLVTVLAQSGVRYLSMGPNAGHRIGYTLSEWGDKPFYWLSPSGNEKVLCWVAGKAYSWFHRGPIRDHQGMLDYLASLQDNGFPYDIIQVRYNIGGDNGPPDPEFPNFVRTWNETYAYPKMIIASTRESFEEFERRYGDQIPEYSGDFTPYWEDGAASSARETALVRNAAERLVQGQALWSMVQPENYPADDYHAAWREILLYNEHTWGAYNSISDPQSDFALQQWKTKQAFALDAERMSKDLLQRAVAPVAGGTDDVSEVLLLNTNPWPMKSLVTLPADWKLAGNLVNDLDGKPATSQRLSTGELAFVATGISPTKGARVALRAGQHADDGGVTVSDNTLSNGLVSVTVDPVTGAITELRRADSPHNYAADAGLNTYHYVAGRNPKDPKPNGPVTITVKERGPVVASMLVESDAPGCHKLTREVRLVAGMEWVDIIDTLDKEEIYKQEGVHLGFAFNVPDGTMRMETPFAVVRPDVDQLPGACKNYFTVQRWVDVSNDELGVTWATLDAPLIEVGAITNDANAVGWLKETRKPHSTFYSYVMNNYWETNYKAAQDGPTTFRYAIRPHQGYDQEEAHSFGVQQSRPLIVVPGTGEKVQLKVPVSLAMNQ